MSMKGSNSMFDFAEGIYYKCHKISLNRGGSYTDSSQQLKNKKATINLKNNDNECLKYVVTVTRNPKKSEKTDKE